MGTKENFNLIKFNSSPELNDEENTSTGVFKSPRDIINNNDPKINGKKILSNYLNNKLLYKNNNNIHGIEYIISISNKLHDKVEVYLMAKKNNHVIKNIEEESYVCNYHSVILFKMKTVDCEKLIGYILFSLDTDKIYVYDIYILEKYRFCSESMNVKDKESKKTLYNRLLAEFEFFINFYNVKAVINPIIAIPRIKKLINSQ